MTQQALETACAAGIGPVSLWCAPSSHHPFFAACATQYGVALHTQTGADLGERLHDALDAALRIHDRALVMGTDCPILTTHELRAARAALERSDAVVIPAEDGGYVLLGLARACPAAFRGIDWGSAAVLEQTLARLHASVRSACVLAPLWDVDRGEDFDRLAACLPAIVNGL
jgi:rSAM/selenodomain-associated transferase 1